VVRVFGHLFFWLNILIKSDSVIILRQIYDVFDMICSSCCLESACSSYDIFRQTIRRFSDILKPGGLLLICAYRNSTSYVFNGDKFTDLPLTEEIIRTAFVETGYLTEPICISLDSQSDPTQNITNDGLMINYGFKK
jgi:hypothetical protein